MISVKCRGDFAQSAGALLPLGPVKQYTSENVDAPLSIQVYPGANGSFLQNEDDGVSFGYRNGDWMGIAMSWDDRTHRLTLELAAGARMRPQLRRPIEVVMVPGKTAHTLELTGQTLQVKL
jgi:alpha-glucosidase (family GH31 glycosyl hydrolase)